MRLNETDIQLALWANLSSSVVCAMPNYTPAGWWECDMCVVTKAHYFVEYEIKLSLSDLRADADKSRQLWVRWTSKGKHGGKSIIRNKHDQLRVSSKLGPTRFFYVVPPELVPHVPEWAGIWTTYKDRNDRAYVKNHRAAPRLHSHKVQRDFVRDMQTSAYWRFWRERAGQLVPDGSAA